MLRRWQEVHRQHAMKQTVARDLFKESHGIADPDAAFEEHEGALQATLEVGMGKGRQPSRTAKAACGWVSKDWKAEPSCGNVLKP